MAITGQDFCPLKMYVQSIESRTLIALFSEIIRSAEEISRLKIKIHDSYSKT